VGLAGAVGAGKGDARAEVQREGHSCSWTLGLNGQLRWLWAVY
jgi:hypothetical protein